MAVIQVLGSDKSIRINDYNVQGLVQNFNWAPNLNAQDVFELGRTTKLDTVMELETSGSFDVNASGNLAGILARMKPKYNGGTGAFEGYTYNPVASGATLGVNGYTFTQDDFTNLKFDLMVHEKTNQLTFDRTTWLGCCYPTSISGRVGTDGIGTETINFAGLFATGFAGTYYDARSVPVTRASSTTVTTPAGYASTTWSVAYLHVNGLPIRNVATDSPRISSFTTNTITITGATIPVDAHVQAVLYRTVPTTAWSGVHAPETVGTAPNQVFGLRGFQVDVFIAPTNPDTPLAADQMLRVQSVDWSLDFRMEALRQVAFNTQGTTIYNRAPLFPLNTSASVTVNEADWAEWRKIMNKPLDANGDFNGVGWENRSYEFSPQYLKTSFALVLQYRTKSGTQIQQLQLPDLRVAGYGNRASVGGRSQVSWNFTGTSFKVVGTNV